MADYSIRVQLMGNPTVAEYDLLHSIMAQNGFYRTVNGVDAQGNQRSFELPHGVYYGSSMSAAAVLRDTIALAVKTGVQPSIKIFVVQVATWAIGT